MRGAKLEIPPPGSGYEQQIASDVAKTKKIANARIHVERAIGRLKWFAILQHTVSIVVVDQFTPVYLFTPTLNFLKDL